MNIEIYFDNMSVSSDRFGTFDDIDGCDPDHILKQFHTDTIISFFGERTCLNV